MDRRVLRPRKETGKENLQPTKRTQRAFSTIERSVQMKAVELAKSSNVPKESGKENLQPAKRVQRAFSTVERSVQMEAVELAKSSNARANKITKSSNVSTQTDCLLTATNAQLTHELILKNELIQKKDQKYIEMLEQFYLQKERLTSENREKTLEITDLREHIRLLQNQPLIELANNGESDKE